VATKRRNLNRKQNQKAARSLAIAIKHSLGFSTSDSKVYDSDSYFSDLDNGNNDDDDTSSSLVKNMRIRVWNYQKKYAKKVENLDLLDVFDNADENEWRKQVRMNRIP
jgi:hypothetical protein